SNVFFKFSPRPFLLSCATISQGQCRHKLPRGISIAGFHALFDCFRIGGIEDFQADFNAAKH
ncbi:MAG: hypothetical protein IJI27_07670, partial [Oscillospiraceae bacterium]|nr:hypothetical protein [Oscillospiraceae bacterium]